MWRIWVNKYAGGGGGGGMLLGLAKICAANRSEWELLSVSDSDVTS